MAFITPEMIAAAEARYGEPLTYQTVLHASAREMEIVRGSQKHGRKHDITMAIFGDPGVLVIAKPWYTTGLYRLPSGGLHPGESLEEGAAREGREETGVTMELVRYHLRIDVDFIGPDRGVIPWTSHVFSARYLSGEVDPEDTDEIREARWCPLSDLLKHRALMLRSSVSGLRYRAELQDWLIDHWETLGWIERHDNELIVQDRVLS